MAVYGGAWLVPPRLLLLLTAVVCALTVKCYECMQAAALVFRDSSGSLVTNRIGL